ncbi:hypothetical protein KY092_08320 [Natronomonas gomsonensis]|uniref:hypothetical protein n=1 Tax=Natronomonas gomsonensis TaxID=1046043 RepID=UPI0020CA9B90|nr:hypothetical protein [Natronomonas gomsonensis]MCY4730563.1 hypothetical protein [Natronomonas gomsonensis]
MPPNTNAALVGYAMVGIEAAGLTRLVHGFSLGKLGYLLGIICVTASFIGWFYWMHLYGLYDDVPEGETVID